MHNQHIIPLAKKYLESLLGEFSVTVTVSVPCSDNTPDTPELQDQIIDHDLQAKLDNFVHCVSAQPPDWSKWTSRNDLLN